MTGLYNDSIHDDITPFSKTYLLPQLVYPNKGNLGTNANEEIL